MQSPLDDVIFELIWKNRRRFPKPGNLEKDLETLRGLINDYFSKRREEANEGMRIARNMKDQNIAGSILRSSESILTDMGNEERALIELTRREPARIGQYIEAVRGTESFHK